MASLWRTPSLLEPPPDLGTSSNLDIQVAWSYGVAARGGVKLNLSVTHRGSQLQHSHPRLMTARKDVHTDAQTWSAR